MLQIAPDLTPDTDQMSNAPLSIQLETPTKGDIKTTDRSHALRDTRYPSLQFLLLQ